MGSKTGLQSSLGLAMGAAFGFSLHKAGLTYYEIIIKQLLLRDFTVVKVMLSAIITGMIGVYFLNSLGVVELSPSSGSLWTAGLGGTIFGLGFGILGYCPGTALGAVGRGALDGLVGVLGIMLGIYLFTVIYPELKNRGLVEKQFKELTFPEALGVGSWVIVIPAVILLSSILFWLETAGL
jgi:hypothetical protein